MKRRVIATVFIVAFALLLAALVIIGIDAANTHTWWKLALSVAAALLASHRIAYWAKVLGNRDSE